MKHIDIMVKNLISYNSPSTKVIEIQLKGNMMLLNSDGTTGNASIDSLSENEDYKDTVWQ